MVCFAVVWQNDECADVIGANAEIPLRYRYLAYARLHSGAWVCGYATSLGLVA